MRICTCGHDEQPDVEGALFSYGVCVCDEDEDEYVRLAVEVEGGVYVSGRHTRGAAFEADAEKYAEVMLAGWRLLRVTPRHIRSGQAIEWIERALK